TAFDDRDARAFERRGVGELKPRDFPVLVGDEARPVEDRLAPRPTVTRRVLELVRKTRGVDQQLFWDAAADQAGAADTVLLGHHDARAVAGGDPRGAHAAGASSNDEEIDVMLGHIVGSKPSAGAASRCRDPVFSFRRGFWR